MDDNNEFQAEDSIKPLYLLPSGIVNEMELETEGTKEFSEEDTNSILLNNSKSQNKNIFHNTITSFSRKNKNPFVGSDNRTTNQITLQKFSNSLPINYSNALNQRNNLLEYPIENKMQMMNHHIYDSHIPNMLDLFNRTQIEEDYSKNAPNYKTYNSITIPNQNFGFLNFNNYSSDIIIQCPNTMLSNEQKTACKNQMKNMHYSLPFKSRRPVIQTEKKLFHKTMNQRDKSKSLINKLENQNDINSSNEDQKEFNDEKIIDDFQLYMKTRKNGIVDFICTQRGGKEVEKYIKRNNKEHIQLLLEKIINDMPKIMTDIYGNYFIQKIIKFFTTDQIKLILLKIKNDYVNIAKNISGTHVLQALLDGITTNEEEELIMESIKNKEIEMAYNNEATHVLQKIIQKIKEDNREDLNKIILTNFKDLSLNANGICLIKKFISTNSKEENKNEIKRIIIENCLDITQDPFGNYAIQFILEKWSLQDCEKIINIIIDNSVCLSKQKFSSNVVELVITKASEEQRKKLFNHFFMENRLLCLIKNKYGKFVIQKFFKLSSEEMKQAANKIYQAIMQAGLSAKDTKLISIFFENLNSNN